LVRDLLPGAVVVVRHDVDPVHDLADVLELVGLLAMSGLALAAIVSR